MLVATTAAALTLLTGCGEAVAPAAVADAGSCRDSTLLPTEATAARAVAATLCLVNVERGRHGLSSLVEDRSLRAAAEGHSRDMAARDYFEHDTPEGVRPWMRIARQGYQARLVGENLAWGEAGKRTPAEAMRLWMESPGHRANVLEPDYTGIGIGLAFDAPEARRSGLPAVVYTTTFGSAAVSTG